MKRNRFGDNLYIEEKWGKRDIALNFEDNLNDPKNNLILTLKLEV